MINALQLTRPSLSAPGKWGFLLAVLMISSFRADFRLQISGLLVHPYLVVLPFAYVFSQFDLSIIPRRVTVPLILFFIVFSLASLQNENPLSEIFKVAASIGTFLFFAFAVKTEKDFRWMSWGLMLIAVAIGIQGFLIGEEKDYVGSRLSGINVLEGIGNKNAQSLFTLPGVFLGSFLLINSIAKKQVINIAILITFLFFTIVSIFLSANRSGWVGLAVIFFSILLVIGLKGRTLLFSAILVLITYLAIDRYAGDIFERKRKQTTEGYASDVGRQALMFQSIMVGLENPILGVGMDALHYQMALRLGLNRYRIEKIDTHFLPGYLFGATGIFSLSLFIIFLVRLPSKFLENQQRITAVRQARMMTICFVLLFIIRSLFSREILYSPTFISGLGIVFGYYLLQVRKVQVLRRG